MIYWSSSDARNLSSYARTFKMWYLIRATYKMWYPIPATYKLRPFYELRASDSKLRITYNPIRATYKLRASDDKLHATFNLRATYELRATHKLRVLDGTLRVADNELWRCWPTIHVTSQCSRNVTSGFVTSWMWCITTVVWCPFGMQSTAISRD